MEALKLKDYTEWWITYEEKERPEANGIWDKVTGEPEAAETSARHALDFLRKRYPWRNFAVQKITVHRTAEKLDW